MITLKDYFMGRDEKYKSDLTEEIKTNAVEVVKRVNMFAEKMGWLLKCDDVASGWRPPGVNDRTKNAAVFSKHLTGKAIDIEDLDKSKGKQCLENKDLLDECGIWMEHPDSTPTWCHFQIIPPKSGHRFFYP